MSLERLLARLGLPASLAERLRELGIHAPEALALLSPAELSRLLGVNEETAGRLIREALAELGEAVRLSEALAPAQPAYVTTGVPSLDRLLGGGLRRGMLVEIAGEPGSGKTQLCHQLCVTVQLPPEEGGLGAGAVYIDTEGSFHPGRLLRIAARFSMGREVLRRVLHARAHSFAQLYALVLEASRLVGDHPLVIVDNIASPLRAEYAGDPSARRWALLKLLQALRQLASQEAVVVATNQVVADPETGELTPVGGSLTLQMVDARVVLRRLPADLRAARLEHAVDMPPGEARFRITDEGVVEC